MPAQKVELRMQEEVAQHSRQGSRNVQHFVKSSQLPALKATRGAIGLCHNIEHLIWHPIARLEKGVDIWLYYIERQIKTES